MQNWKKKAALATVLTGFLTCESALGFKCCGHDVTIDDIANAARLVGTVAGTLGRLTATGAQITATAAALAGNDQVATTAGHVATVATMAANTASRLGDIAANGIHAASAAPSGLASASAAIGAVASAADVAIGLAGDAATAVGDERTATDARLAGRIAAVVGSGLQGQLAAMGSPLARDAGDPVRAFTRAKAQVDAIRTELDHLKTPIGTFCSGFLETAWRYAVADSDSSMSVNEDGSISFHLSAQSGPSITLLSLDKIAAASRATSGKFGDVATIQDTRDQIDRWSKSATVTSLATQQISGPDLAIFNKLLGDAMAQGTAVVNASNSGVVGIFANGGKGPSAGLHPLFVFRIPGVAKAVSAAAVSTAAASSSAS